MWLRLGVPFIARPHHCSCRNKSVIDEYVDYILTCKQFNGSIKSRHELLAKLNHYAIMQVFSGQIVILDNLEQLVMSIETLEMVTS